MSSSHAVRPAPRDLREFLELLRRAGWRVVRVAYRQWDGLATGERLECGVAEGVLGAKVAYLEGCLRPVMQPG